jgi:hypothetical protein
MVEERRKGPLGFDWADATRQVVVGWIGRYPD